MMKISLVLALFAVTVPAGAAFADANSAAVQSANALKPPKIYTGVYQPKGPPAKSSAFAPHPRSAGKHIYGAPIQAPILQRQPKKPTATAPRSS